MKVKKRLGEMLIDSGLLTEERLQQALVEQKKAGLKLGQYLTRQGVVNEQQVIDMLSRQLNIAKYHPDQYPLDLSLAHFIPIDTAQKYQVAPLRKKGRLLTIAMVDPLDINTLDFIEMLTNSEVEPVVCSERELNQIISSLYGSQSGLGSIMESLEVAAPEESQEEAAPGKETEVSIASLQDMAGEAPVVRLANSIFAQAIRDGASDVHISPQQNNVQMRFRIDGKLIEVPSPPKALFLPIVARIKILANMDITMSRVPQDGRFTLKMSSKEINVRVSSIPTIYGENLVLRMLDMSGGIYTLDRLGMIPSDREKIEMMSKKPYGLILSTGPTGSGKSTSLYAILSAINKPDINIITLEDPVEYRVNNVRQVQLNRKAGMTFASGLRSILRQDPDVILVGELRDLETIEAAITAAETGHVVFGTLHTNSAQGTVNRIIDAFPGNLQDQIRTQLSTSIIGVVAQTLIPKIGGGRVAAYEILVCTSSVANLIRENKTFRINSSIQTGAKYGMQLMDDALFKLWKEEKCTIEDVLSRAHVPDDLAKRIVNAKRGIEEEVPEEVPEAFKQ